MGLRIKIIAALLSILLGLAVAGSLTLHWELDRSYREREYAESISDLRRLLFALEAQMMQLDTLLGSWSNWTALYDHSAKPDRAFAKEEMTVESLRNANFDWLLLVAPDGKLIEQVEVPQADGGTPLNAMLQSDPTLLKLANALSPINPQGCGIVQPSKRLTFACYRPLHNTEGVGPTHGMLIIGRWIEASALDAVREQTQLDFSLTVHERIPPPPVAKTLIKSAFGQGTPEVEENLDHMEVKFPITAITGRPVGEVKLHWPRKGRMEAIESMRKGQSALLLMIAITGALMIFVVDRLVVSRLQTLRRELSDISTRPNWVGHVTSEGRDEVSDLANFINRGLDLIRVQVQELHNLSMTDTLTGLPNRRRFDEQLGRALGQHQRTLRPMALALFDVDYFKKYNDTYGHPAGDLALVKVAQCLRLGAKRPNDLPARIGGEEFAVIFEDTDLQGARECADTIRQLLTQAAIPHSANSAAPVMTISCGIAIVRETDTPDTLYSRADAMLYLAKEHGRNQVFVKAPKDPNSASTVNLTSSAS